MMMVNVCVLFGGEISPDFDPNNMISTYLYKGFFFFFFMGKKLSK